MNVAVFSTPPPLPLTKTVKVPLAEPVFIVSIELPVGVITDELKSYDTLVGSLLVTGSQVKGLH